MPIGSYATVESAKINAKYLLKKIGCDAVKIESNNKNQKIIKALTKKYSCNGSYRIHTTI